MPEGTGLSVPEVKGKLKDYTPEERRQWVPSDTLEIKIFQQRRFKYKVIIKTEYFTIEFIQYFLPEVLHKMAHLLHAFAHTATQGQETL